MISSKIKKFIIENSWLSRVDNISHLASGEYNDNYRVESDEKKYVFRINHGSQLFIEDQIEYEYNVLKSLENTGVTPGVLFFDNHPSSFAGGVLLMNFIPGRPLDYRTDIGKAAYIFSRIHGAPVKGPLISQLSPVDDICDESMKLINQSITASYPEVRTLLLNYHEKMLRLADENSGLFDNEDPCIVNTEVNSKNFIISRDSSYLVDWEKAVISYRYQDLGHFLIPTTTLWKSDFRFSTEQRTNFLDQYRNMANVKLPADEIDFKTGIMEDVILLRALSWCYMAYGSYSDGSKSIKHDETFSKIKDYLDNAECFLR